MGKLNGVGRTILNGNFNSNAESAVFHSEPNLTFGLV